ncbi:aminotransferase-like domain-containing protein [Thiomicrolovo sp. ZZH C-3]
MKRQFIREILDVITADTISFAGGLPDADLFPLDGFKSAAEKVLGDPASLQYSRSQGYAPLREKIAQRYCDAGFETRADEILITTGSQQAINLIAMSTLPYGVTVELPAYLGALSAFRLSKVRTEGVALEHDGIAMTPFRRSLARTGAAYLIPDFQNPTGLRYSTAKRNAVAKALLNENALLIEDAPYSELYFDHASLPISAAMPERSFHLGSFSKILAPGLRVGWVRASEANLRRLLIIKETIDLHTSTLDQRLIDAYWEAEGLEQHLATLRIHYRAKKNALAAALRTTLPDFIFDEPHGGMFLYGRLPGYDTRTLVDRCVQRGVAFVPGSEFYPGSPAHDELRLNFTHTDPAQMHRGVSLIAEAYREQVVANITGVAKATA